MASRSVSAFAESVTVAALENDPYPIYARLRREAPVCFIPAVGLWFVTRYQDVDFVGTHPELFTAELDDSPVDRTFGSPTILTVDGERHHELRRALDAKYRPRHVNTYIDPLVRPIAAELLDGLAGRDQAELMADYLELSVLSLGSVLGVAHLPAGWMSCGSGDVLIRRITSTSPLTATVTPNATASPTQGRSSNAFPPRRPR